MMGMNLLIMVEVEEDMVGGKRTDVEKLESGVEIDWGNYIEATNPSAGKSYQRKICVKCALCKEWRFVTSCCISEIRKGKQRLCLKCHIQSLAETKIIKAPGKTKDENGYIRVRETMFTAEELVILKPMMLRPNRKFRQRQTSVLEHRAVMALHIGRALTRREVVHHINGIRDDNRIENLELVDGSTHGRLHSNALKLITQQRREIEELKREIERMKDEEDSVLE